MKKIINIGCSSFYNTYWKGVFYPIDMPRSQWFDFYCSHFNTYEINATFYKFPTLRVMQNWYNKAPEGFLYSVKVPKQIMHIKKLADCKDEIAAFYTNCTEGLKEKLGCILFQLPPSFKYTADNLDLVLQSVNTEFNNVIEFRNISWFIQDVYDALKKHNITFCSVGHPTLPDTVIHTTALLYIRLHGSSKMFYSEYSPEELYTYATALNGNNNGPAYIYFNNTASEAGIVNAIALKEIIKNIPH